MAGVTVSFVANPALAAQMKEIASADGISASQAVARASALGAMLPASARRAFRRILDAGDHEAHRELAVLVARAIAQTGNNMVQRQLLKRAEKETSENMNEEALVRESVVAVQDYLSGEKAGKPSLSRGNRSGS